MMKRLVLVLCLAVLQVGDGNDAVATEVSISNEVLKCLKIGRNKKLPIYFELDKSCRRDELLAVFCEAYILLEKRGLADYPCKQAIKKGFKRAYDGRAIIMDYAANKKIETFEKWYKKYPSIVTGMMLGNNYLINEHFKKAHAIFKEAAELRLSDGLDEGIRLSRSDHTEVSMAKKKAGYLLYMLETLARMHVMDFGLAKDYKLAFNYMRRAARIDQTNTSRFVIAYMHKVGFGTDVNDSYAESVLKKLKRKTPNERALKAVALTLIAGLNQKYAIHPSRKCEELFIQKKYKASYKECEKTDKDDLAAQLVLAHHYLEGLGTKTDLKEAEAILKTLVDKKHNPANHFMGMLHENPKYDSYNIEKAIEYYKENGRLKDSAYRLARIYGDKGGKHFDVSKSKEYMRVAAIQGEPEAKFKMFELELKDNKADAMEWLKRAAIHRHEGALKLLPKYSEAKKKYKALSKELDELVRHLPKAAK